MAKRRSRKKGGKRRKGDAHGKKPKSTPKTETKSSDATEPPQEVEAPPDERPSEDAASPRPHSDAQRRGRIKQPLRRALLAVTLLSIFVLPLAQLARANTAGSGAVDTAGLGPGIEITAALPGLSALGDVLSGSLWSLTILGVEITDPLAAAIVLASSQSGVLLLAALIPVALTLVLGRVFCGWICPARLPVELASWLRRRSIKRTFSAPWLRWVKYGVLAAGLGLAALTGWNLVALIYPPAILVREAHYLLAYGAMGWGAVVVAGAFVADLVVDRGAWCRGLCPGGALYSLLGHTAVVRIGVAREQCTSCKRCQKVCPLGLEPTDEPLGECDRCGLCQRACRDDALRYRLGLPFIKKEQPDGN